MLNLGLALGSRRGRRTHSGAHSGAHKRGWEARASTSPRAGRQARCSADGAAGNPGHGPGAGVPVSSLRVWNPGLRGAPWGARGLAAGRARVRIPHA